MSPDETIRAFVLKPDKPIESKSKDIIDVKYRGVDKSHHAAGRVPVHIYEVTNVTKKEKGILRWSYWVNIWYDQGECHFATDDCVSRVACKHLRAAYGAHIVAIETGFISNTYEVK